MKKIKEYITEKFKISKDIIPEDDYLAEKLYKRLLSDKYHLKNKIIHVLNDWIEDNDIKDINKDIFYTYSNKDRIEKEVEDTSYLKFSSHLESYSTLIDKLNLQDMMTSDYKKINSERVKIYINDNKLLFIYGITSVKFIIYMNAWNKS